MSVPKDKRRDKLLQRMDKYYHDLWEAQDAENNQKAIST